MTLDYIIIYDKNVPLSESIAVEKDDEHLSHANNAKVSLTVCVLECNSLLFHLR